MPTLIPALPDNALYSTSLLTGIETFRNLSQRDSVSPETIASLLSLLVTALDNAADQLELNSFKAASLSTSLQSHENSNSANFTAIDNKFTQFQLGISNANTYLFNKIWNEICSGSWMATDWQNPVGRYNNETGYYELNDLTNITFAEALRIFVSWMDGRSQLGRANLPDWRVRNLNTKETNMKESGVESWWGCNSAISGQTLGTDPGNCGGCNKLKTMKYVNLTYIRTDSDDEFGDLRQLDNCPALEHVDFNRIEQNIIWIRKSTNLDKSTISSLFMACPIGATIHLNSAVYSKLSGWDSLLSIKEQKSLNVTSNY